MRSLQPFSTTLVLCLASLVLLFCLTTSLSEHAVEAVNGEASDRQLRPIRKRGHSASEGSVSFSDEEVLRSGKKLKRETSEEEEEEKVYITQEDADDEGNNAIYIQRNASDNEETGVTPRFPLSDVPEEKKPIAYHKDLLQLLLRGESHDEVTDPESLAEIHAENRHSYKVYETKPDDDEPKDVVTPRAYWRGLRAHLQKANAPADGSAKQKQLFAALDRHLRIGWDAAASEAIENNAPFPPFHERDELPREWASYLRQHPEIGADSMRGVANAILYPEQQPWRHNWMTPQAVDAYLMLEDMIAFRETMRVIRLARTKEDAARIASERGADRGGPMDRQVHIERLLRRRDKVRDDMAAYLSVDAALQKVLALCSEQELAVLLDRSVRYFWAHSYTLRGPSSTTFEERRDRVEVLHVAYAKSFDQSVHLRYFVDTLYALMRFEREGRSGLSMAHIIPGMIPLPQADRERAQRIAQLEYVRLAKERFFASADDDRSTADADPSAVPPFAPLNRFYQQVADAVVIADARRGGYYSPLFARIVQAMSEAIAISHFDQDPKFGHGLDGKVKELKMALVIMLQAKADDDEATMRMKVALPMLVETWRRRGETLFMIGNANVQSLRAVIFWILQEATNMLLLPEMPPSSCVRALDVLFEVLEDVRSASLNPWYAGNEKSEILEAALLQHVGATRFLIDALKRRQATWQRLEAVLVAKWIERLDAILAASSLFGEQRVFYLLGAKAIRRAPFERNLFQEFCHTYAKAASGTSVWRMLIDRARAWSKSLEVKRLLAPYHSCQDSYDEGRYALEAGRLFMIDELARLWSPATSAGLSDTERWQMADDLWSVFDLCLKSDNDAKYDKKSEIFAREMMLDHILDGAPHMAVYLRDVLQRYRTDWLADDSARRFVADIYVHTITLYLELNALRAEKSDIDVHAIRRDYRGACLVLWDYVKNHDAYFESLDTEKNMKIKDIAAWRIFYRHLTKLMGTMHALRQPDFAADDIAAFKHRLEIINMNIEIFSPDYD